jgi:hypothetical protein
MAAPLGRPKAVFVAAALVAGLILAQAESALAAPNLSRGRATPPRRPADQQLTRWRHVGYWAHAAHAIPVHARATLRSPVVVRLRFRTEEGLPEVYLVLRRRVTRDGRTWLKLALPMRPNGRTGWVVHGAVGKLHRVRSWLVIDRSRLRAKFFERNRLIWSAPIGIGKPLTPTPRGLFWARELFESNQSFFGPYAFGTSAYANVSDWPGGGVVGLHGTSLPNLIPGRPSHGCIRLRNRDIVWLVYHMPLGTPVAVVN